MMKFIMFRYNFYNNVYFVIYIVVIVYFAKYSCKSRYLEDRRTVKTPVSEIKSHIDN